MGDYINFVFPRLKSRGPIEAQIHAIFASAWQKFPRLKSRGPIEAKVFSDGMLTCLRRCDNTNTSHHGFDETGRAAQRIIT